jgi:hypothetical protein
MQMGACSEVGQCWRIDDDLVSYKDRRWTCGKCPRQSPADRSAKKRTPRTGSAAAPKSRAGKAKATGTAGVQYDPVTGEVFESTMTKAPVRAHPAACACLVLGGLACQRPLSALGQCWKLPPAVRNRPFALYSCPPIALPRPVPICQPVGQANPSSTTAELRCHNAAVGMPC